MADPTKSCDTCTHFSTGIGALAPDGKTPWNWKECAKGWGKPTPVGVLKNLCGTYMLKKVTK